LRNTGVRLLVLVAALAAVAAWSAAQLAATPAASGCVATMVRYQPAKHPTLGENPWILATPQTAAVLAFLPTYPRMLRDARVNRADGLVLWQSGTRMIWSSPAGTPVVTGRRIGGGRPLRITSTTRFPKTGCWELTARAGGRTAGVVARVVQAPKRLACAPTVSTRFRGLRLRGRAPLGSREAGTRAGRPRTAAH
jgi:hypothetical protein